MESDLYGQKMEEVFGFKFEKKDLNRDFLDILKANFLKVLFVDLKTKKHEDLLLSDIKAEKITYAEDIDSWLLSFADKSFVHEDDIEYFKQNTDIEKIREHFKTSDEPIRISYRRLKNDEYNWVEMVISKSSLYSEDYQMVILYVMDTEKYALSVEETYKNEKRQNRIINALSKQFFNIYRADLVEEMAYAVYAPEYVKELVGEKSELSRALELVENNLVQKESYEIIHEFNDYKKWPEMLGEKDSTGQDFKGANRWSRVVLIVSKRDEFGKVTEVLYAVRDIEEIKIREVEQDLLLREALKKANAASESKSRFLSNMSHDIRTPMNAIVGFSELAKEKIDDKEAVLEYLEEIKVASSHLVSLINEVLDMSHIESGKMQINSKPCNLVKILHNIGDVMKMDVLKKNISLELKFDEIKHENVLCDDVKINQILFNLLSNAVKYNKGGGTILISCKETENEKDKSGLYEFVVKDTGIGMSPEFLDKIFETFERERETISSGIQGTGLGMPITKGLVELMGGEIEIKSKKNVGTTCIIRIPFDFDSEHKLDDSDKREATKVSLEMIKDKKFLLAEDNLVNQKLAKAVFNKLELYLEIEGGGYEAVKNIESKEEKFYDCILMDMQMPDINGIETTRLIRNHERKDIANTPVVMVTANVFEEDKKAAYEAGANGFITKPINIDEMISEIIRVITENFKG